MNDEQKTQYAEITQAYQHKSEEASQEFKKAIDETVERTKQILTEPQRAKYDELLKKRAETGDAKLRRRRPKGLTPYRRAAGSKVVERAKDVESAKPVAEFTIQRHVIKQIECKNLAIKSPQCHFRKL